MFNLIDGVASIFDEEGLDVPDINAARALALKAAREIMAEDLKASGVLNLKLRIDVTDESGLVVLSVPFSDVVTIGHA